GQGAMDLMEAFDGLRPDHLEEHALRGAPHLDHGATAGAVGAEMGSNRARCAAQVDQHALGLPRGDRRGQRGEGGIMWESPDTDPTAPVVLDDQGSVGDPAGGGDEYLAAFQRATGDLDVEPHGDAPPR